MNSNASPEIPHEHVSTFNEMPAGLGGYWWETENVICVPFVMATHPGDGTFGAWLRILESRRKLIFFPTVISARLDSILRVRGYTVHYARGSPEEVALGLDWVDGLGKDFRRP